MAKNEKNEKNYTKDILVGVLSAIGTAFLLWLVGAFSKHISDFDQQAIADKLKQSDPFKRVLVTSLKDEPTLKGPKGDKGDAVVGPEGRSGKDNYGPIGGVLAYAGSIDALSKDWHVCDGTEVRREDFQELFRVIGTRYGGDGSDTFRLPNYSGYFLRGFDPKGEVDKDRTGEKRVIGSEQGDAIGPHDHPVTVSGNSPPHAYKDWKVTEWGTPNNENDPKASGGQGYKRAGDEDRMTAPPKDALVFKGTSDKNNGHASETRPKNIAVYWIIRLR